MSFTFRFTKKELLKLFLVCAALPHFWTIFLIISEADLINKRDWWYFGGYSGYLLTGALVDSILLFVFVVGLSFLFPKSWKESMPYIVAGTIALIVGLWAVGNQLFFFLNEQSFDWFNWVMLRVHYRQLQVYPVLIGLIALSAAAPIYALSQNKKLQDGVKSFMENVQLLSYLYLALDFFFITIAVIRNIY